MKNKNLVLFIGVGFIMTIAIWGFVGGCGTTKTAVVTAPAGKGTANVKEQYENEVDSSAEGLLLDEQSIPAELRKDVPAAVPQSGRARQTYIVTQGDTLWKISKKFGVNVDKIKEVNSLKVDSISVGQSLIIPGAEYVKIPEETEQKPEPRIEKENKKADVPAPVAAKKKTEAKPGTAIHTVRKNDNLWRIAQVYGTTADKIASINGLPKNARLTPGQEILVPSSE